MSVLNENTIIGASGAGEYEIEQSLRFDDDDASYLTRTPSVAGNRKTWTWSGWVKRGKLNSLQFIFCGGLNTSGNLSTQFQFDANNKLYLYSATGGGGSDINLVTTSLYRDPSAWYHIVLLMDTTQSAASNRVKIYVNGEQVTALDTATYPSQNYDTAINNNVVHNISNLNNLDVGLEFNGYLAEVNLIDGQALTPDSFGETGTYNEWKPIEYAGTYGTNGFYLPFEQDYAVEGFSSVTYEGKGVGQYIGGTGFSPSLTWIKARNQTYDHQLFDVIRGPLNRISSNSTSAESSMTNSLAAFNTDGFTLGDTAQVNLNNGEFVAWNWDMGGTNASNTNGSITSSVRANTTYGQSIVSYSGNATAGATVGHGLSQAPDMFILKNREQTDGWGVYYGDATDYLYLNQNYAAADDIGRWNDTAPTSSVFTLGNATAVNSSSEDYIAYCFHSVTGYSSFGSYSGTGSSGNAITTGFAPAFVMIKRTDTTGNWEMLDSVRDIINDPVLYANSSNAESVASGRITFTSTGFTLDDNGGGRNASGGTYIYMAFADTREYAYWYDQSGNNNDWTSEGGLTESDVMVDSPTNNFCTMNPLRKLGAVTYSQGNCISALPAGDNTNGAVGTFAPSSGKWYWEATSTHTPTSFGIADSAAAQSILKYSGVGMTNYYLHTGIKWVSGVNSAYGASGSAGDIIGTALDMDNRTIQFFKNGSSLGAAFTIAAGANMAPACFGANVNNVKTVRWNFGADSSFAGNKTPQGNQDSNDIGDFYYAPPTGFLALCTANLPSVDVIPSENFNTVLYTGTGSSNAISNLGLTPDFTWIKSRSNTEGHGLVDSVRGATKLLSSNTTDSEATSSNYVASLDSDGFTVGTSTLTNGNGYTYVAWNWKAGGSASSNSNGTITSSVSANPAAGFSIVTYTGSGSAGTVGHGLSKIPDLIITKGRSNSGNWVTWHKDLTGAFDSNGGYVYLNSTGASATTSVFYDGTGFTSSVFKWRGGNENVNQSSRTYISYCFNNVDGFLKTGTYGGNGSTNGPFVHCGFKPAFLILRNIGGGGEWIMQDDARQTFNADASYNLAANRSVEENNGTYLGGPTNANNVDWLSNGFKIRADNGNCNAVGGTFLFIAFAENPFKHSNAR